MKILGTIHLWRPQRKGMGKVSKFVAGLQILFFRNRDLLFIFADGGDGEGNQKINFCGYHKWMTPYLPDINKPHVHFSSTEAIMSLPNIIGARPAS